MSKKSGQVGKGGDRKESESGAGLQSVHEEWSELLSSPCKKGCFVLNGGVSAMSPGHRFPRTVC